MNQLKNIDILYKPREKKQLSNRAFIQLGEGLLNKTPYIFNLIPFKFFRRKP